MNQNLENRADQDPAQSALRQLALKANGLSGADVERLVREARQKARRAGRSLSWQDLAELLAARKPRKPDELRRRMAVHEAGHAVARLAFGLGRLVMITIDGPTGSGYVETEAPVIAESEEGLMLTLVVQLAGRAAEEVVIGSALAGSGNGEDSDLARATELASHMEISFGYGYTWPLLYRPAADRASLLCYHREIAERVNARLDSAYAGARNLMEANRDPLETIAEALLGSDTLEGNELTALISTIKPRLSLPEEGCTHEH